MSGAEDALFMSLTKGSNLFDCQSCTEYQIILHIFGHIQVQFVFSKVSYSPREMYELHALCIHISHESHCTALIMTIQDCTAAQPAVRFAVCTIPSINSRFNFFKRLIFKRLMLHDNAFCSLHTPPPYLMFYNTFCKAYTETWGVGSFQYHLPTLIIQPNLFIVKG